MKQFFTIILAIVMLTLSMLPCFAVQVIGSVLSTDIRAYINGAEIPTYNIDGKLAIVVSDLNNYGFTTSYNNELRKSSVTRNPAATSFSSVPSKASGLPIGMRVMDVYQSDITVELDGRVVPAFNVDNRMAIYFTELKEYGEYGYDNSNRISTLNLSDTVPKHYASGITIYATNARLHDSVGGVKPIIYWKNVSGKTIKYITFTVTPYNRVGDQAYSEIGWKSTTDLKVTGPISTFSKNLVINPELYGEAERWDYLYYKMFYKDYPYSISHYNGRASISYNTGYTSGTAYLNDYDFEFVYRESEWDPVWYNDTIFYIKIDNVYIEYTDGTTETISSPNIISNLYRS